MTRTEAQEIANTKLAALGTEQAIKAYTALRSAHWARTGGREVAQAMVLCGNALEKMIGEADFEDIMNQIDEQFFPGIEGV